ncbi:MAG: diguanylate cyclase [Syntrophaceae bacterium]
MHYCDSLEQSSEYLRMAISHMGRFQIPYDPTNYSVWYEYVSGKNENLRVDIDTLLSESKCITPELITRLYEKYIAIDEKMIMDKIRRELRAILVKILHHIADAEGQFKNFGDVIKRYSQDLKEDLDLESVARVVDGILSESKSIVLSGAKLQERLQASTDEVEKLSKNIEQIREQATTDLLTGIKNRRFLINVFAEEVRQVDENSGDLCLIMADIDHFKRINDTYGHLMGDKVLKTTAEVLKDSIKGRDHVVRYGGEEFVILLPDTPLTGALILADKICTYFKNLNWKRKDTSQFIGPVHLSFGVARYRKDESLENLIQRADKALYQSKRTGRCRVTSETDIETPEKITAVT